MFKPVIFSIVLILATAQAAPAATPETAKRDAQTPASTAKLTPIVGPIVSPIAHIPLARAPILPQVSPYQYAYSYPAPIAPVAYVPGGYSIEQHGYNIAY
ncbi:uncharacterized protein [Neodiprion pinetum]|uniref:uncharacterized protein LOC124175890 n=1 Tax=Neodiprion fabricii TaxID=2872261 RepID=UPI001ED93C58|nr:uncharacterized protein LOC124175890 [Neodiprion fabricii]XP_046468735.1 uncharacterized protein LOC124212588 [Neodiprion pinetum]XP_046605790.1 uncharacterized protein LOC124298166 [Neodiprion virginianus]